MSERIALVAFWVGLVLVALVAGVGVAIVVALVIAVIGLVLWATEAPR